MTPENTYVYRCGRRACRECARIGERKYRASPKGQARSRIYFKRINARPDRKAKLKDWQKKSYGSADGWTRRYARLKVQKAIQDGKLIREPCEICGESPAHGHHDDYGKPLAVRWLCRSHHREWHRQNKPLMPPAPLPQHPT